MKTLSVAATVDSLRARGVIPPDAAPYTAPLERPWFIAVVLGAAGWLAGAFLMGFVWMLFDPNSTSDFSLAGSVLLASAFGLYAADRSNAFLDQFALALSIAGQLSLTFAAVELTDSAIGVAALVAVLQCALLLSMPNRFARTLASFFACIAWALTVRFATWGTPWESHKNEPAALIPALFAWGAIWLPLIVLTRVLIASEVQWMARGWHRIARPALSGILIALSFGTFLAEPSAAFTFIAPTERPTNWLALWPLLGLAAALFAADSAFRVRNHALLGSAIAGALLHIIHFYYMLGTTLIVKSVIMLVLGVALGFAAFSLRARLPGGDPS